MQNMKVSVSVDWSRKDNLLDISFEHNQRFGVGVTKVYLRTKPILDSAVGRGSMRWGCSTVGDVGRIGRVPEVYPP